MYGEAVKTFSLLIVRLMICTPPMFVGLANSAEVRIDSSLFQSPSVDSEILLSMTAGSEVEIKERKGLWINICITNNCGWVRITQIQLDTLQPIGVTNLAALQSGREGQRNNVSASGVRGLDSESLELTSPDYEALTALESLRVSEEELAVFTERGMLESRSFTPLVDDTQDTSQTSHSHLNQLDPESSAVVSSRGRNSRSKESSDDDW